LIEYIDLLKSELIDGWNTKFKRNVKISGVLHTPMDEELEEFEEVTDYAEIDVENTEFSEMFYDEIEHLGEMLKFQEDLEYSNSEYEHGVTIIHEKYFLEYAIDDLEQSGYISKDMPGWIVIDYEATADNMKSDYSEVKFDGSTYFVR
jgi:hypothetical protein